jgi:hypothetical protein
MNTLPIKTAEDALKIGQYIARSGTFGVKTDEGGAIIALMCYQENMSLLEFQKTYHILDGGKPSMRADAMIAKFLDSGGSYEIVERSKTNACAKLWKDNNEPREFSLSIDEVREAGYCFSKKNKGELSQNWKQHPKNMLWARMMSDAIRALDPRVNAGTYTPEEEMDHGEAVEVHDQPPADPKPKELPVTPAPAPQEVAPTVTTPPPASDDPFADMPDSQTDYNIVPVGKNKGKRWIELSRETLEKVVNTPGPLSQKHVECAKAALDNTPF